MKWRSETILGIFVVTLIAVFVFFLLKATYVIVFPSEFDVYLKTDDYHEDYPAYYVIGSKYIIFQPGSVTAGYPRKSTYRVNDIVDKDDGQREYWFSYVYSKVQGPNTGIVKVNGDNELQNRYTGGYMLLDGEVARTIIRENAIFFRTAWMRRYD
jgi:hypothetical protein